MKPKYVGWLQLDACTGDNNRRIQETKDDKIDYWCYIYLFLGRILYIHVGADASSRAV